MTVTRKFGESTEQSPSTPRIARPRASVACLVAASAWSAGVHADNSAAQSTVSATDLQEIVVTATRRAETIDTIPISISAFTQERMDEQGIKSVDDLARFTPGLTFAPSTGGITNDIAIRGVLSEVGASTTGIYIDDTPIQVRSKGIATESAFPQLFDLERVEVLRGPQGTLFGTGSEGGTIRFITPEPDLEKYSGYSRIEGSSTKSGDPSYEMGVAAEVRSSTARWVSRISAFTRARVASSIASRLPERRSPTKTSISTTPPFCEAPSSGQSVTR